VVHTPAGAWFIQTAEIICQLFPQGKIGKFKHTHIDMLSQNNKNNKS